MDRSKKHPSSFESLSFPLELTAPTQTDQLPEIRRVTLLEVEVRRDFVVSRHSSGCSSFPWL